MRIAIFHQHYLHPGQGGGSRFNEMGRMWAAAGHEVIVVAGSVNYLGGAHQSSIVRKERDGDVEVWRCYVPDTYSKSYLGRMWAFFGYMVSASIAAFRLPRPDVIVATSPPLIAAIPGWVCARLRGSHIPWVFEIRDLWPESAVTTGVLSAGSPLTRLLYWIERQSCRSADRINVLTPAFREDLLRRGLTTESKLAFIPNGADIETFIPGPKDNSVRRELGWGDKKVALYAGAHGRANALHQLLDAADELRERADILIACIGEGPERTALESAVRSRGLTNIRFYGTQPKARMPEFVQACDIGLAVLQNNPTFRTVYPNKVFDYMACERPVLLAIDGVARELVCVQAQAGNFAQPEDGKALAHAIREMLADPEGMAAMGANGRAWVLENAARPALAQRYLDAMQQITKPWVIPLREAQAANADHQTAL